MFACWVAMEGQFVAMVAWLAPVANWALHRLWLCAAYEAQYSGDLSFKKASNGLKRLSKIPQFGIYEFVRLVIDWEIDHILITWLNSIT